MKPSMDARVPHHRATLPAESGGGDDAIRTAPTLWIAAAPFFRSDDPDWIPRHVADPSLRFEYVAADYDHDRSRASTTTRQWVDYFRHAWRTWHAASRHGSDAAGYITAFPQLPVMLGLIKRLARSDRPIVAWMFNMGRTYGGAKGVLARFGLRGIDRFVVHSRTEMVTYSRWLRLPQERFIFVPLSIKTTSGSHAEDGQQPFVFAMGTANRDYALLFQVVQALGHRTIVVAGRHAVEGLQRPANVTVLHGLPLEECHRLSQQARVNVIPVDDSNTASGQVTLLETMMYGKAVVATRCTGTVDYIADGVTALMVPPHDAPAMTRAIDHLWNDAQARQRLGQAARAYVAASASFQGVARAMQSILKQPMSE